MFVLYLFDAKCANNFLCCGALLMNSSHLCVVRIFFDIKHIEMISWQKRRVGDNELMNRESQNSRYIVVFLSPHQLSILPSNARSAV